MECFHCGMSLTSDDYKSDTVVTTPDGTIAAHWSCVVASARLNDSHYIEPKDAAD